jgi:hypothetical protein
MIDLAKGFVASPRWRWMPGMRGVLPGDPWSMSNIRVPEVLPNGGYPHHLPDLEDPATLGCIYALVWDVFHDPHMFVAPLRDGTELYLHHSSGLPVVTRGKYISGRNHAHVLLNGLNWG